MTVWKQTQKSIPSPQNSNKPAFQKPPLLTPLSAGLEQLPGSSEEGTPFLLPRWLHRQGMPCIPPRGPAPSWRGTWGVFVSVALFSSAPPRSQANPLHGRNEDCCFYVRLLLCEEALARNKAGNEERTDTTGWRNTCFAGKEFCRTRNIPSFFSDVINSQMIISEEMLLSVCVL